MKARESWSHLKFGLAPLFISGRLTGETRRTIWPGQIKCREMNSSMPRCLPDHHHLEMKVLRDSGQTMNLVVKRRVVLPSPTEPQNIRVSLNKNKKKEDYGIILGCKIYVKEITGRSVAERDGNLQEGDMVYKINNTPLDGLSLKEAKKLLDAAKDKVDIVVKRDTYKAAQPAVQNRTKSPSQKLEPGTEEPRNNLTANQNLYVPPPTMREQDSTISELQKKRKIKELKLKELETVMDRRPQTLDVQKSSAEVKYKVKICREKMYRSLL